MSISKLEDILLRALSDPTYAAKGQALTFAELDTNLKILADALRELAVQDVAGVAEYDSEVTYTAGPPAPIVTYLGTIYRFVAGSPQTGITPGTNPSVWERASTGLFAHKQGTDTVLAEGTPDQIEVGDIASKAYAQSQANLKVPIYGDQTVYGQKTFDQIPLLPDADPTDDDQAARKKYVDDAITNSELDFSNGLTQSGGEVKLGGDHSDEITILGSTPFEIGSGNLIPLSRLLKGGIGVRISSIYTGPDEYGFITSHSGEQKAKFGGFGALAQTHLVYDAATRTIKFHTPEPQNTNGLQEHSDYSAHYTDRSYTSKGYVDAAINDAVEDIALGDLSNVNLSGAVDGDILVRSEGQWVPKRRPAFGSFKMEVNAGTNTATTTQNTFVKAAGATNTNGVPLQDFDTNSQDNRLRYTGAATRKFRFTAALTALRVSAGTHQYTVGLYKNGASTGFINRGTIDTTYTENVGLTGIIELAQNDYVELWIANNSDTSQTRMQTATLSIESCD